MEPADVCSENVPTESESDEEGVVVAVAPTGEKKKKKKVRENVPQDLLLNGDQTRVI